MERIAAAIEASGAKIVSAASPSVAPFEFKVRSAAGESIDLVCYAFTANKYGQEERPADEHRFQVKYGSDFRRSHALFIDPSRLLVTLMFGVHQTMPLFIAVDPAMHSPTWFSSSVEFKQHDLEQAAETGWHGWERDRVAQGRRRAHPPFDLRTEAVLAFRPEHFITYSRLERLATGLDASERLLLIDRVGQALRDGRSPEDLLRLPSSAGPVELKNHPLLAELDLSPEELLDVLRERFRLMAAVRGGVAERHLERLLRSTREIQRVHRLDQDALPDFEVEYRRRHVRIECKNVLRRLVGGVPKVDFQKTRAAKGNFCSRYYRADQFEVLAACLHPVTARWEFNFCETGSLPPHEKCVGRISQHVRVEGPNWLSDLASLLSGMR